jgi:hypothetical protein
MTDSGLIIDRSLSPKSRETFAGKRKITPKKSRLTAIRSRRPRHFAETIRTLRAGGGCAPPML